MEMYDPPHPGEMLQDFMGDLTVTQLASDLGITRASLSKIINGRSSVSPEMALRLEKAFPCTTADMWLTWQANYDLWHLRHDENKLASLLNHVKANVTNLVPANL